MDTQSYIAIISGILFLSSEVLPFITTIKANGLLEIGFNVLKNMFKRQEIIYSETSDETSDETQPLLTSDIKRLNILIEKLIDKLDNDEYIDNSMYFSSIDGQSVYLNKGDI